MADSCYRHSSPQDDCLACLLNQQRNREEERFRIAQEEAEERFAQLQATERTRQQEQRKQSEAAMAERAASTNYQTTLAQFLANPSVELAFEVIESEKRYKAASGSGAVSWYVLPEANRLGRSLETFDAVQRCEQCRISAPFQRDEIKTLIEQVGKIELWVARSREFVRHPTHGHHPIASQLKQEIETRIRDLNRIVRDLETWSDVVQTAHSAHTKHLQEEQRQRQEEQRKRDEETRAREKSRRNRRLLWSSVLSAGLPISVYLYMSLSSAVNDKCLEIPGPCPGGSRLLNWINSSDTPWIALGILVFVFVVGALGLSVFWSLGLTQRRIVLWLLLPGLVLVAIYPYGWVWPWRGGEPSIKFQDFSPSANTTMTGSPQATMPVSITADEWFAALNCAENPQERVVESAKTIHVCYVVGDPDPYPISLFVYGESMGDDLAKRKRSACRKQATGEVFAYWNESVFIFTIYREAVQGSPMSGNFQELSCATT